MRDDFYILVARRFQDVTYLQVSMVVLMLHDWLILLDREVEYIWRKGWNISKVLFIISRYGLFLDMPITITLHVAPYGSINYGTFRTLYKISAWLTFFGISVSESILLLRTNALYSGSKRVTIPLTLTAVTAVVIGIAVTWIYLGTSVFGPPPNILIGGCYLVQRGMVIFFNFLILLFFELAVVILTIRSMYRDFRSGTPLLRVIYRDNVAFFLILFILSLSTILILALAPAPYNGLDPSPIFRVVHSIVCCRIILNLRQAASYRDTLSLTEALPGLVFEISPEQRTNRAEPMQLGAVGMGGDEEAPSGGPTEDVSRCCSVEG